MPEKTPKIYSVNELTKLIKGRLESEFRQIWVSGEISNFSKSATGHFYFSLKDEHSLISCALFRGIASSLHITDFFKVNSLTDLGNYKVIQDKIVGKKIKVFGDISVYAKSGSYQIIVKKMELEGLGDLQQRFEELKKKLSAKGYFVQERKKPLPPFPERIGVVTSPTGAAVRDILNITRRRWSSTSIVLYPAVVQGAEAAADIARGIRLFNSYNNVDVIIIGRGGGSLEDLWAFNEEIVADAVFESHIPIVSAVGHEVDFSISDFTADLRAPTPSAAAELVLKDKKEVAETVYTAFMNLKRFLQRYLEHYKKDLMNLSENRLKHDLLITLQHYKEKLENWSEDKLRQNLKRVVQRYKEKLEVLSQEKLLHSVLGIVGQNDKELEYLSEKFTAFLQHFMQNKSRTFEELNNKLNLLNPLNILKRGYSVTYNTKDGSIIKSSASLQPKDTVRTIVAEGEFQSLISEIKRG